MSDTIIRVDNISKQYRLGQVGSGALSHDINRAWYRMRGLEDPYKKIGDVNDRSAKAVSDYVWALKDISFEVKQGEVLGIIGRNGAGKSTLLKILSRVTSPTTGSIKIRGRVASLLEVGTGFHPELSGRDNIFLNGAILGMTRQEIKRKFDEIVDFAGVERYIDTPVKRYSSGMYVRLAFGVAAHLEPEILIVDEVLAVGDAEFQQKALGKMKDVSEKDGRTVLFVSHNMAAMQKLCQNGLLLKNGRIYYSGEMQNTLNQYQIENKVSKGDNLSDRKDRKGNGKLRVVNYKILNNKNEQLTSVVSGGDFSIELILQGKNIVDIKDLRIDIGIADQYEKRLSVLSNEIIGKKFSASGTGVVVNYFLKHLPLNSGEYSLIFFVLADKEIADWIEHAGELIVEEGDFYATGKINRSHQGALLMEYDATIKSKN